MSYKTEADPLLVEFDGLESLGSEIQTLTDVSETLHRYGTNPGTVSIMKLTNLLSGTALETVGLESFSVSKGNDPESQLAIEALGEKIKEKSAEWAAKILSVAKSLGDKVKSILSPIWDKVEAKVKALTSATWDKTKELGKTIKAHPYKTMVALAGAALAVGAVVAVVAANLPGEYANESALTSFVHKVEDSIKKIKWPLGKITTIVVKDGKKIDCVIEKVTNQNLLVPGSVQDLGYTKVAINSLFNLLKKSYDLITQSVTKIGTKVVTLSAHALRPAFKTSGYIGRKAYNATGDADVGEAVGYFSLFTVFAATATLLAVIYKLIKEIVAKCYLITKNTLQNILHSD